MSTSRFLRQLLVGVLIGIISFSFVGAAGAASLTSINDQMVDQSDGAVSNHELSFTTPTGAAEGATITITFASAFDTSSITEDDVDLEVGGTDRTTASTCAGSEQASVAITSDVVTITICASDGGAIAVSASIVIKIGINATGSGTGSNRITNPTSVGSYGIAIAGTFGDTGSITIPIIDASSGSVTATVPATSSGSGGGGGSTTEVEVEEVEGTDETEVTEGTEPEEVTEGTEVAEESGVEESESQESEESAEVSDGQAAGASEQGAAQGEATESTTTTTTSGGSGVAEEESGVSAEGGSASGGEESTEGTNGTEGTEESGGASLATEEISYFVNGGDVALEEEEEAVTVLPNRMLTIVIPESALVSEAESISVTVGGETYSLSLENDAYSTVIVTPETSGAYQSVITVIYTDGTVETLSTLLDVESLGYVFERVDGDRDRINEATVTLYQSLFGEWTEVNETVTGEEGTFGWYVENGIYRIGATKDGYQESLSAAFSVDNHIATTMLEMELLPVPISEIIASDMSAPAMAAAIIGSAIEQVDMLLDEIRTIPEVQVAADIAAPVVVTLTVTSSVILWNVFNLAPLLQYLFTSPLLLIGRRKRKSWGVVYNAATKLPIDLAIVRLFKLPENRLVMTRVTDKLGRFFFLAQPGEYRLGVVKPVYSFPSQILEGKKEDGKYLDLYHGETLRVTDRDTTIAVNVPLDPALAAHSDEPKKIRLTVWFRRGQRMASYIGILAAVFIVIIEPGVLTILGFALQVVLFMLFRRLAYGRKPKSWGIVYDQKTKHPLTNAIVRIFEPKYNKLLEAAVTDRHGRYSFLVGPSEYFATFERDAYQSIEVRPIDYRGEPEPKEVALDIGLRKKEV